MLNRLLNFPSDSQTFCLKFISYIVIVTFQDFSLLMLLNFVKFKLKSFLKVDIFMTCMKFFVMYG